VARAPIAVFDQALIALARQWGMGLELPEPSAMISLEPVKAAA
jgi:hypothetical protein